MIPHVDWYYEPIVGSVVLPFTKVPGAGTLFPRTGISGVNYDSQIFFSPLPTAWTSFGNHYMLLQIDLQDSMRAKTQIFFNGGAMNHPNPDGTPNWWYYWKQAYNPPPNSAYTPTGQSRYIPGGQILIGNDAFADWAVRMFDKAPLGPGLPVRVHWHGSMTTHGIYNYIFKCGHEDGHRQMYTQGISGTAPDTDMASGDGVNDAWELRNNFDPADTDTSDAYWDIPATHPDKGKEDREVIADILSLAALQPNKNKWREDWSTSGLQWGDWGTRNPAYSSYFTSSTTMPYHPWQYTWIYSGQVDHDPPWSQLITSLSQLDGGGI